MDVPGQRGIQHSAAKLSYNYTVSGNAAGYHVSVPFTVTDWLAMDLGVLKETAGSPAVTASLQSTNVVSPADCLFNWAESNYSSLFAPAGAASQTSYPYYYRYYSATNTYLGISSIDEHVYYLGSTGVLEDEGAKSGWLSVAGCPQ